MQTNFSDDVLPQQGRGGGVKGSRGEGLKVLGQHDGRKTPWDGKDIWAEGNLQKGAIGSANSPHGAHHQAGPGKAQQKGGEGGRNWGGGNWSSGNGPPGNWSSGNIQNGKKEALQLCQGHVGNVLRGTVGTASKSLARVKNPSFAFDGNHSVIQAQHKHVEEKPDLTKILQTNETVSDSGLETVSSLTSEGRSRAQGAGSSSKPLSTTESFQQDERLRQLEQRVSGLEQQFVQEKSANETLLASVERVLAGKVVEEKDLESKLVKLIRDIKMKIIKSEVIGQVVSADFNGSETLEEKLDPKHHKSPHVKVDVKVKSSNTCSVTGRHPGKR